MKTGGKDSRYTCKGQFGKLRTTFLYKRLKWRELPSPTWTGILALSEMFFPVSRTPKYIAWAGPAPIIMALTPLIGRYHPSSLTMIFIIWTIPAWACILSHAKDCILVWNRLKLNYKLWKIWFCHLAGKFFPKSFHQSVCYNTSIKFSWSKGPILHSKIISYSYHILADTKLQIGRTAVLKTSFLQCITIFENDKFIKIKTEQNANQISSLLQLCKIRSRKLRFAFWRKIRFHHNVFIHLDRVHRIHSTMFSHSRKCPSSGNYWKWRRIRQTFIIVSLGHFESLQKLFKRPFDRLLRCFTYTMEGAHMWYVFHLMIRFNFE